MTNIIIIPTYNEKDSIELLIKTIFNLIPDIYIMVVDDNSPDGTAKIIEKLKTQYPNLSLLKRAAKQGLGKAYVAGFKKIMESRQNFENIIMMDGDFSHNPKYLPEMIKLSKNHDLVIGSRYIHGGSVAKEWEFWRKLLSYGANIYVQIILGFKIKDWTAGFNLIKTSILKKINLDLLLPRGYAFQFSFKHHLLKNNARAIEFPIHFEERVKGKSKMSSSIITEAVFAPWKILFSEIKDFPTN
ncbi:MAG: dolichol-phosphate mannosyltransferase [Parcubacteria group bacterium Athens0714_26]|nr:MAG: dolichol-phosphate mannosyltransferase [Parcubacteria group bacterium Athens1014_26]TSD02802.1 MAG: dolichol-phosphate mannosyltransferase [Parcubacteria group bacterium Athens0714_26]